MGDSRPHRPGRRFALQVVLPISALLGATMAVLSVLLAWTALEQNHYAAESSRRLAKGAVEVAREAMVRTIVDYAVWDEAVRHLALTVDEDWAEGNLAGLGKTVGADLTFALDPAGQTTYGLIDEVGSAGRRRRT
jgi:sensor domain CHASE-containing protein